MTFTPTEEQLAIIAAARDTTDNLLVNALAGAAKTSTLVLVAEALPDISILCLAFNKKIAVEMQERLPSNCTAMTLNSLGHRTWSEATGRRLKLDRSKGYNIMRELIDALPSDEKSVAYESFSELMRIVAFGKSCGFIPTGHYEGKAKRLMDTEDFFDHIEQELSVMEQDLVVAATLESLKQAFAGTIDYDDQILMPTIFQGAFPRYPLVLVDEAQDLSALNHAMLRKMVKKRLIAVGDPCQAIYGFRGAHKNSMNELQAEFSMRELPLSVSFRCPKTIVKAAQWRAPNMRFPEWAVDGSVSTYTGWGVNDLPEQAAILCRNNAPLFALAVKLLKNGRHAEIGGTDIIKTIVGYMRKLGSSNITTQQTLDAIDRWEEKQKEKNKRSGHGSIEDKAECMRIFAHQGKDLSEAIAYALHIMNLTSPLKLLTGHKAKGLEFDNVFILDQKLISKEGQDPNLRYVMITRSKDTLTYIDLTGFQDGVEDEEQEYAKAVLGDRANY